MKINAIWNGFHNCGRWSSLLFKKIILVKFSTNVIYILIWSKNTIVIVCNLTEADKCVQVIHFILFKLYVTFITFSFCLFIFCFATYTSIYSKKEMFKTIIYAAVRGNDTNATMTTTTYLFISKNLSILHYITYEHVYI